MPGPRPWTVAPISTISTQRARSRSDPIIVPRAGRSITGAYGEILPRAYWAPEYVLSDYWLSFFALGVPLAGYEWVRDNTDAVLVNVSTGEILQVEYGVFG